MMKYFLAVLLCALGGLAFADSRKPNIVYIMADDLGWGDNSVHGGGVATPHIDGLFRQGVELSQFMGWCVCSPTRAMLLTGRHPFRVGTGPEVGGELAKEETTIAEGFRASGKDIRKGKLEETDLFTDIRVRVVPVGDVLKQQATPGHKNHLRRQSS